MQAEKKSNLDLVAKYSMHSDKLRAQGKALVEFRRKAGTAQQELVAVRAEAETAKKEAQVSTSTYLDQEACILAIWL